MRLLLINNNPAVSRLINLSAQKYGYEIEEFKGDDFDLNENFDITIADNEAVSDNSMLLLRESGSLGEIIYIGPKGLPKPIYADYFLQKPFLPTDFVDLVKKIEQSHKQEENVAENRDTFVDDTQQEDKTIALDLDDMDSLDLPMPDDDDDFMSYKEEKLEESLQEEDSEIPEENFDSEADELADDKLMDSKSDIEDDSESEADIEVPDEFKLDEETDKEEGTAILDSEEIDEVKQLLDDEVEVDELETVEDDELDGMEIDELIEKDEDTNDNFDMEENLLLEETNIEDAMEDISQESEVLGDLVQEDGDLEDPEEILKEIENIEEESGLEMEEEIEASDMKESETEQEVESFLSEDDKASIDDICEDDLAGLFEEGGTSENVAIHDIKEELQTKIASDVKKVLDKDEIREALKGLKVNISISFDEE